jgi:transposase
MMYAGERAVYLAAGATDMRKSFDGLAPIVKETFKLDPFGKALFVFCNRAGNRIKILEWERTGFWLHCKRLEKGGFGWPSGKGAKAVSERELRWLPGRTRHGQNAGAQGSERAGGRLKKL